MTYKYLRISQDDTGIGTITVSRPDALNALNSNVLEELEQAFHQFRESGEVRGIIFTGEGEKAFIAGADIREMASKDPREAREFATKGQQLTRDIQFMGKPVIAAVNGYALGGGCELALACHLRYAAANAVFGQPEVGLGLIPGWGGTQRLPRLIGPARATELILSTRRVDAAEAKSIGLINELFTAEDLIPEARSLLSGILNQGPRAVAFALEAINKGMNLPLSEGLDLEANLFALTFGSDEMKEGTSAFLEKRDPEFETP